MDLFNTLDLTHWAPWGDLLLAWKHKYPLPTGGNSVVLLTHRCKRKISDQCCQTRECRCVLNTDIMFSGCTQEWISSVFKISDVFWISVMSLFSSWYDIIVCDKLVVYDVWFAEDDNTGFLSFGVDIFDRLFL